MEDAKVAVVTGATAGIGLAVALALANRGYALAGVGRSAQRCEQAGIRIREVCPGADVRFFVADLGSQRQVRELAAQLHGQYSAVDALVLCAGTVSSHFMTTEDGVELQFAVNHLSGFLLTHELLPLLRRAQGRVIAVSSNSHRHTRLSFPDVQQRPGCLGEQGAQHPTSRRYSLLGAYKRTKLCNVLFAAELNRRLGGAVRAFAADPGLVRTDIGLKGTDGLERLVWRLRMGSGVDPSMPGEAIAWLAADEQPLRSGALYWYDKKPVKPSSYALREDPAALLWQASERLCAVRPGSWNEGEWGALCPTVTP